MFDGLRGLLVRVLQDNARRMDAVTRLLSCIARQVGQHGDESIAIRDLACEAFYFVGDTTGAALLAMTAARIIARREVTSFGTSFVHIGQYGETRGSYARGLSRRTQLRLDESSRQGIRAPRHHG